jgi:4-hydroxy-2-oxoglutarate aldolase
MTTAGQIAGRLEGVFAPVVTTFDERTGELDRAGFEQNLRAHASAGLRGVIVAGTTGEATLLDENERASLVAWAREVLPSDRLVIAGTGAESTRASIRLGAVAAREGADAVIVIAPHYYGDAAMTGATLTVHYERIADESPVPVVLYNMPKYMHYALPPETVANLALHENIVGMKESSGNLDLLTQYLSTQSTEFRVLTGNGSTFAGALAAGVPGGILAVATFAPALALEVYAASQRGDRNAALSAQTRLGPLASQIVGGLGVPGVKAALDQVGLAGGSPRPPLLPLHERDRDRVAALLRAAELLVAA